MTGIENLNVKMANLAAKLGISKASDDDSSSASSDKLLDGIKSIDLTQVDENLLSDENKALLQQLKAGDSAETTESVGFEEPSSFKSAEVGEPATTITTEATLDVTAIHTTKAKPALETLPQESSVQTQKPAIVEVAEGTAKGIVGVVEGTFNGIMEVYKGTINGLKTGAAIGGKIGEKIAGPVGTIVGGNVGAVVGTIVGAAVGTVNGIVKGVKKLWHRLFG